MIRAYTKSEFGKYCKSIHFFVDHAAMVLKFGSDRDEVFFLEATSNHGVALKRWSSIKHALGSFYSKIVIRHLKWDRPDEALELLEKFIDETEGNKYKITPLQLIKHRSKQSKEKEEVSTNENLVEKGRAFFCSELVAKAYKCS